jgi:NADH:ubiquinone oxidoreductase subunit D
MLANIALRASGFRAPTTSGHQRMIESLESTVTTQDLAVREKWVRKIKAHSQKRNHSSYDSAGGVSPSDLTQILKDLTALEEQVRAWLKEAHPELLEMGT